MLSAVHFKLLLGQCVQLSMFSMNLHIFLLEAESLWNAPGARGGDEDGLVQSSAWGSLGRSELESLRES